MIYSRNISCAKESLITARNFVKESLGKHAISDLDVASMVLAIDEVLANLIIHGHKCNKEDQILLEVEIKNSTTIIFKIYDEDEFFNIEDYEAPTLKEIIKAKRKGGMGLILVKKIMDRIEIGQESGKNCCRLYKKIDKE